MINVMVDLETVDNKPTAAIISIGAVTFDRTGIMKKFHVIIDMKDAMNHGLTQSKDTMNWWSKQSPDAQKIFTDPNRVSLNQALESFALWLPHKSAVKMWGNGAAFDNPILANAYNAVGLDQPWLFWNDYCYRTISRHIATKRVQQGTHHNALDDAISQADHLIKGAAWAID